MNTLTDLLTTYAPPVQLTKPSWWRRVFLHEKARVVFAEPPKEGETVIIRREHRL